MPKQQSSLDSFFGVKNKAKTQQTVTSFFKKQSKDKENDNNAIKQEEQNVKQEQQEEKEEEEEEEEETVGKEQATDNFDDTTVMNYYEIQAQQTVLPVEPEKDHVDATTYGGEDFAIIGIAPVPPMPYLLEVTPSSSADSLVEDETEEIAGIPAEKELEHGEEYTSSSTTTTTTTNNNEPANRFPFPLLAILCTAICIVMKPSQKQTCKHEIKTDMNEASSMDSKEGVCVANGVPALIEPTQWMVEFYNNDLDLSAYESLKATELRQLLRDRNCDTRGTRENLTRRLVTVYQAELATLTVKQLRSKLRGRGLNQTGLKVELVRRLIEAGYP